MTDIPLNRNGGESRRPPSITLAELGQYVDFAVINIEQGPAYVYGTNQRAMTKDGKPKTKDIVTVLVIRGTGLIGKKDERRPVQPGDVATINIEGQDRWDPDLDKTREKGAPKSWSSANEDLGGVLNVGDVGRWKFDSTLQGKGAEPRKLRLFQLRRHKPEEAAQTERCRELYRQGTEIAVGAPAGAGPDPFEEQFLSVGVQLAGSYRTVVEPWL